MADPVDHKNLMITGRHKALTGNVAVENEVTVIVTQAYGPTGENQLTAKPAEVFISLM